MGRRTGRIMMSVTGVAVITVLGQRVIPVNPTTVGFAYLLLILVIASTWGFIEALITCLTATVGFNYFFLPPVGTLVIAEPGNWVALFSFLATAVIASRLSAEVKRRAVDAIERRQDVERLYTFSRSILLIEGGEPFAKQLAQKLADTFPINAVLLYDRRTGEIHRAGPADFEGLDDQLRDVAQHGSSFFDAERKRVITAVRLGSEPIAALALQGARMPDSVVQGIANLVAIGLERARAQELTHEIEAARRSEHLRTTLIDTMVHEFKTPLTSIKAATTSLLASPDKPEKSRVELLAIADQEADHLKDLIDDAVEMARLDHAQIDLQLEPADIGEIVSSVVESMKTKIEDRTLEVIRNSQNRGLTVDRRLVQLAIKQLLDNALKYSPGRAPVQIRLSDGHGAAVVEITDHGNGIPEAEQSHVFQRFYRSPSVNQQIPGSGLGLSIADRIVQAHSGTLAVTSRPGETTFRITLPFQGPEDRA